MTKLQVEQWPIERLIPYARNARTHSDEQVAQIAASMLEFGWTNPILVANDGVLIAGHARLLAARKLAMTEVPVIVLDHLNEAQRRALVIADNRLALNAGWDEEMLRVELEALKETDFDLELLGFSDQELENLLREPGQSAQGQTEDDGIPEAQETSVTQPGDVWRLGNHRLLCGDSTQFASLEKVLAGEPADLVFTDPPYNVKYEGGQKARYEGRARERIANDALGADFEEFLSEAIRNILAVSQGAVYICMSSSELDRLLKVFRENGGHWSTFIIWAKNTFTLGRSDYHRQYEPILYGWREGGEHYWCGARDQGDVWFINKPAVNDLHPTMKPVELVERAVQNSSKSGAVVLDPFGGSGSTLIACEKTGRHARLVELDPRYCDVIVRRWQEFADEQATLESDGRRFDELVQVAR